MNTPRDALVIVAAGAVGTFFFGRPVLRTWRSRAWPRAAGTVASSHAEPRQPDGTGVAGRRLYVRVVYRYTVGGKEFTGERYSFFMDRIAHRREESASEDARRYAKGTKVDVRHDPNDPTDAVIDTTIPWDRGAMAAFSVIFLVLGLVGTARILLG